MLKLHIYIYVIIYENRNKVVFAVFYNLTQHTETECWMESYEED